VTRQRLFVSTISTALALGVASASGDARAASPEDETEARADYDAGAAAYDRRDYGTAAARFARADERVPNARALQLAMASALLADDAALAMTLVDRSSARAAENGSSPAIAELATKLRARFESRAARLRLVCAGPCTALLDGRPIREGSRWVTPGPHAVVFTASDGARVEVAVAPRAGETVAVPFDDPEAARALAAPRPPATESPPPARGISPVFFWSAAGATVAAAGIATVFTVVLENRHDDFVARPTPETAAAGESAQANVRIAWAAAGALAITTGVFAWLTDFGAPKKDDRAPRVAFGPTGFTLGGRFD